MQPRRIRTRGGRKRGAAAIMFLLLFPVLIGFAALAIDVGFICNVAAHTQNTADAGALAGAFALFEDETDELAGLEEAALERSNQIEVFFRDPSGTVLPADFWYPSKTFWSIVKARTTSALRKSDHAA